MAIMKKKCPNVTRERLERVTTQRFFMVDRKRVDREGELREEFQVLGSTGNVYTVTIQKLPSCSCRCFVFCTLFDVRIEGTYMYYVIF